MKPYAELSRGQKIRRRKRAGALGVDVDSVPDPRGKHKNHSKSETHRKWAARILSSTGYVKIRVGVGHPLADPNGYAYEHLVVWVSCGNPKPREGDVIHHRNGNKTDNRIENLEVMSRSAHHAHHIAELERDPSSGRIVGKKAAGRLLDGVEWSQFPGERP